MERTFELYHSFITLGPKKLSRKRWTEKQKHSQEYHPVHLLSGSNFQAKKPPPPPHRKPYVQKISTKKLYTEEIMSVSAVPNEVTRCVDNPKPNL